MTNKEKLEKAREINAEMHILLHGPPGAVGPGKVVGRQKQLRALSLEMMKLLRNKEGGDE